jgi:hypothetical protein
MRTYIALAVVAGLAACAPKAENIEPAAISTSAYEGWDCRRLAREKAFTDEALVRASDTQDRAASTDALMVFLIGVPTSGGGIKGEVARLKGNQEAIRRTMVLQNCPTA